MSGKPNKDNEKQKPRSKQMRQEINKLLHLRKKLRGYREAKKKNKDEG